MLRRPIETTRLSGTSVVVSEKPPPGWSPDGKYLVAIAQKPSRRVLYSNGDEDLEGPETVRCRVGIMDIVELQQIDLHGHASCPTGSLQTERSRWGVEKDERT